VLAERYAQRMIELLRLEAGPVEPDLCALRFFYDYFELASRAQSEERFLDLDPPGWSDGSAPLGQVTLEGLDGRLSMTEARLCLSDVVQNREVRLRGIGGAELDERVFELAGCGELEACLEVRVRLLGGALGPRGRRPATE
jgi:hypothetical protein